MSQETSKRKKTLTSAIAVLLAAVLLIGGGTYAYLQGETDEVVNEFNTNEVLVDLTETPNDYDIIPGTSQDKDPTVTVNNTVDAYVYVIVTDTTGNLVTYEIADGWTLLDGYDNVYYREVAGDAEVKDFPVLKNNTVSYDAALENSDMLDDDGNLKDGIELTFKAYAIQKVPFNNPVLAYTQKTVATGEELTEALSEGQPVLLSDDLSIYYADLQKVLTDSNYINLNSRTLTVTTDDNYSKGVVTLTNQNLTIENGTVEWNNSNYNFDVSSGSTLSLINVNYTTDSSYGIGGPREHAENSTVNIIDSTVYVVGGYILSSNASTPVASGIEFNIENSKLTVTAQSGDNAAILLNVPGTLNITNSTITADRQTVVVRGGDAFIKDSALICTGAFGNPTKYQDTDWSGGNEVPMAALVVGNRSASASSYAYPASCTLSNTNLVVPADVPEIYAAACNGQTATVKGAGASQITSYQDANSEVIIID